MEAASACASEGEIDVSNSTQVGPSCYLSPSDKDKDGDGDEDEDGMRRSSPPNNSNIHLDANAFFPFVDSNIFLDTNTFPFPFGDCDRSSSKSSTAAAATKSKSLNQPNKLNTLPSSSSKKHQTHAPCLHFHKPFSSLQHFHPTLNHSQTHFTTLHYPFHPLVHSIHMLRSAQFSLDQEVQRFQELGKEIRLLCDDSNEGDRPFDGWASELNHLYSNRNVLTLETRFSEAEGRLKEREMKIVELEETIKNMSCGQNGPELKRYQDMEAEVDSILKEKIEAEIEHLLITRSCKELSVVVEDGIKLTEEMRSLKTLTNNVMVNGNGEEAETIEQGMEGGENIMKMRRWKAVSSAVCHTIEQGMEGGDNVMKMRRRKAVSSAVCFGIHLSLLVLVLAVVFSRATPKSAVVVPT